MQGIKILYITTEISPFLEQSSMASNVKSLVGASKGKLKLEARVFTPFFGLIKLKNRIHNIYRLSGINIAVGKEDFSLVVKVASIKEFKTQVYFTDNEDLFQRKGILKDQDGNWYGDNDTRFTFFGKSVPAIIKELNWSPDIVHFHGLFSALIPMYFKTTYKNSPILKNTKCVYTFYPEEMKLTFKDDMFKKVKLREVKEEHFEAIGKGDVNGLMNLAATFSDCCTRTFEKNELYDETLLDKFNVKYIAEDSNFADNYMLLYEELTKKS